ncbi:hypothetical protein [Photobacterium kagoshimensis]|uniref:hypothetical protein n=1 Tax=Photobacterium kagoshimensis TaxID=2910242 RepID=UPI003D10F621
MNIANDDLMNIAQLFLRTEDVNDYEWECCAFVFEFGEGHISNSGFLYNGQKVIPATADIDGERLLLGDTLMALREDIFKQCGHKFIQLLFQMENETKRFKIDFEFDDATRWAITPATMFDMREKLKPNFE